MKDGLVYDFDCTWVTRWPCWQDFLLAHDIMARKILGNNFVGGSCRCHIDDEGDDWVSINVVKSIQWQNR